MTISCTPASTASFTSDNPFAERSALPFGAPPLDRIHDEDFAPAIDEGMRTLWDDGLAKVMAGLTSFEELARITV